MGGQGTVCAGQCLMEQYKFSAGPPLDKPAWQLLQQWDGQGQGACLLSKQVCHSTGHQAAHGLASNIHAVWRPRRSAELSP